MTRVLIGRLLVAMSFRDPQGAGDPVELALRCPVLPPADYGPAAAGRVAGPPTDHGELPAGRIAVLAQLGVAPPPPVTTDQAPQSYATLRTFVASDPKRAIDLS
jgi:hypothetical protein